MENSKVNPQKLPIGYWLKRTDVLLTEGIQEIHSEFGFGRTEWQLINTILENPALDREGLTEVMRPFADEDHLAALVDQLAAAGVVSGSQNLALTEKGQLLHGECLHKQKLFRDKAMRGISEQEYGLTLSTLEKIVKNLT